jgi:pimeloyl-ACP methyl ester carboxylesterase
VPPPSAIRPEGPLPAGVSEERVEAGGISFRQLVAGPAPVAGAPGPGPVVLLHGFGARADLWVPLLRRLSTSRRVIAPDLPCHGGSGQLPGKARTIGSFRQAMDAWLDAQKIPPVALVGSSLGGALATMMTLDRPARVDRLVLLAASGLTAKLPGRTVRLYFPYILRSYLVAPRAGTFRSFLAKGVFHDPRYIDEAWLAYLEREWKDGAKRSSYLATANSMRRPDASVAADLERVRCPTLVVWGKEDRHFDWKDGEAAARRIPGARFVAYDGCGHLPLIEQWRPCVAEVTGFLGQTRTSS